MSYCSEPDSHIRDKVKVSTDLSHRTNNAELKWDPVLINLLWRQKKM